MTKYIDQKRGFGKEIVIQFAIAMLVEAPIPLMWDVQMGGESNPTLCPSLWNPKEGSAYLFLATD